MTARALQAILSEELAREKLVAPAPQRDRARETVFAAELPGFGVRHYATGRSVYIVQCRMGGRLRTVTIGSTALVSPRSARDVARRVLLRAQVDENPADARTRARTTPSYSEFLETYWRTIRPTWKPNTQRSHDGYRRTQLDHAFPGQFIDGIETADVARWFAESTERTGPGAANRAFEILRAMFNKAEEWGVRAEGTNPCRGIRPNKRRKCERHLSEEELARLGRALKMVGERYPLQCAALTLILLTGCRKSEIILLSWSEVRGNRLRLEDSKTGPRTVWLGDAARRLLDELPRRRGEDRVFPIESISPRSVLEHPWRAVRDEARLPRVRIHDLRHSFASFAAARSETLPMIGRLLGHTKIGSTARYAHVDDRAVLEACERIGVLIEEHMR